MSFLDDSSSVLRRSARIKSIPKLDQNSAADLPPSIRRKRINPENVDPHTNTRRRNTSCGEKKKRASVNELGKAPRVPLVYNPTRRSEQEISLRCASAAMPILNETPQEGPKYELVVALGCIESNDEWRFHSNFIVMPIGSSTIIENNKLLCFAEVVASKAPRGIVRPIYTCRFAYILGPAGSKTGLNGCTSCKTIRGFIQHPKPGLFSS